MNPTKNTFESSEFIPEVSFSLSLNQEYLDTIQDILKQISNNSFRISHDITSTFYPRLTLFRYTDILTESLNEMRNRLPKYTSAFKLKIKGFKRSDNGLVMIIFEGLDEINSMKLESVKSIQEFRKESNFSDDYGYKHFNDELHLSIGINVSLENFNSALDNLKSFIGTELIFNPPSFITRDSKWNEEGHVKNI